MVKPVAGVVTIQSLAITAQNISITLESKDMPVRGNPAINKARIKAWKKAHPQAAAAIRQRYRQSHRQAFRNANNRLYHKQKWQQIWFREEELEIAQLLARLSTADHYESIAIMEMFYDLTKSKPIPGNFGAAYTPAPVYKVVFDLEEFNRLWPEEI